MSLRQYGRSVTSFVVVVILDLGVLQQRSIAGVLSKRVSYKMTTRSLNLKMANH